MTKARDLSPTAKVGSIKTTTAIVKQLKKQ